MLGGYPSALALTVVVEAPIVAAFYRGHRLRMALLCAAATAATHLVMHFGIARVAGSYAVFLLAGEVFATLGEALAYALAGPREQGGERGWGRALIAAAVANGASYAAGLALL